MAEGAVSSGVRAIHGVFGPLLDAALIQGRGAATMWQVYQQAYERLGREPPPAIIFDMNTYRSWLGEVLRSVRNLGAAADEMALVAEHIAPPLGYVQTAADFASPSMVATFKASIATELGVVERWSSVAYNNVFPATVGQLRGESLQSLQESLDEAAMEEGAESPTAGGTVVSLGDMYVIGRGI